MSEDPFFRREGDVFHATPACRGPWDPKSLHGANIVGLLAWAIEEEYGSDEYFPARLTTDMYRLPGFDPITLETQVVRDGYRIKVIDAEFFTDGVSAARATCQLLRKTANSEGKVWSPEPWDAPAPEDIPAATDFLKSKLRAQRSMSSHMGDVTKKRIWISERRCLVDDIPLSPWLHVAVLADFANPWANSGEKGLGYINSDVTLYLHRYPVDDWVGMEVVNHQATDGVAIGECNIYDRNGCIGTSTVTGPAQTRKA